MSNFISLKGIWLAWALLSLASSCPAWAANPPLDCRSPKAPEGYVAFGVGRASLKALGSVAAARDAAAKASAADLPDRVCPGRCGCAALAPLQPYTFGQEGDEICHMTVVSNDAVAAWQQSGLPATAERKLAAAPAEMWAKLGAGGSGRRQIVLAVEGGAASWLRGKASGWLAANADVAPAADCRSVPASASMAVCLRMIDVAVGANHGCAGQRQFARSIRLQSSRALRHPHPTPTAT